MRQTSRISSAIEWNVNLLTSQEAIFTDSPRYHLNLCVYVLKDPLGHKILAES
jgi:hypothetical protein